jgi:hypothetical protein
MPPDSVRNWYCTERSESFSKYSVLLGVLPLRTLPKVKTRVLRRSCGATAVPLQVRDSLLPPSVTSVNVSHENAPVTQGAKATRRMENSLG